MATDGLVRLYPKSRVAAGFQAECVPPRSIVTMATGLISTSDSKYCFWRRISAPPRAAR